MSMKTLALWCAGGVVLMGALYWWMHCNKQRSALGCVFAKETALQIKELKCRGVMTEDSGMPSYQPTPVQRTVVSNAFCKILFAYEGERVEDLRDSIARLPAVATNFEYWAMRDVSKEAYGCYYHGFLLSRDDRDFATPFDFDRYAELNIIMGKFLGELLVKRRDYSGYLKRIDRCTLVRLNRYKSKFHLEGRAELEKRADVYIADWKSQIESENGFTRCYMRSQVSTQFSHVLRGEWTCKRLLEIVRHEADDLSVMAGYTPKWLKEFEL